MRMFPLGFADLGLLIGLYFLPGVVLALPAAAAGRRCGDTRVVLSGLLLMAAGGLAAAFAPNTFILAAGRVCSGAGAVLLNVLMSKMITDWFAGRELPLAMSIFINSFPIGIGLALLTLGSISGSIGLHGALVVTAVLPLLAFVLVAAAYRRHGNDRASAAGAAAKNPFRLAPAELSLVCIAGAMWGIFNGGFAIMMGFAPIHLAAMGMSAAAAGTVVAVATWAVVASVQTGGILAQKWDRPTALMIAGCAGWGVCLLVAAAFSASAAATSIILGGLLMGLPVGTLLALPGQAVRAEHRAAAMGIFYLWLYVGHGALPPLAGFLQDRFGATASSLVFTAALALMILALYVLFRMRLAELRTQSRPLDRPPGTTSDRARP
jgi:cyanate permease